MAKLEKLDMQKRRLAILFQIDRLEEERCDFCSEESLSELNKSSCDCPASVEVAKLGKELMKLVSKRRKAETEKLAEVDYSVLSLENLTVEKYKEVKASGATDTTIMKKLKVGTNRFYKWKRAAGLKK